MQDVSHRQRSFYQLHLQVHTSVSAPNAITKMPPHRVLSVDTSLEYYIVFQGVIASEGRRLEICQSGCESDGGTLKPLTCHSSLSTNMLPMCKCGNVQCPCRKCVEMCHLLPQITSSKLSESLLAKSGMESLLYVYTC